MTIRGGGKGGVMRYVNPFAQPGIWLRGNTHCHSTRSDGEVSAAERFALYRNAGYDFLVLTDHDRPSAVSEFSRPGFLAISGAEYHPENPYGGDTFHIVAVNVADPIDARSMTPLEVLRAVANEGGLAIMAHPYWSGCTLTDYEPLRGLYVGMEVYNHIARRLNGTDSAELLWDAHLDRLGPVWGIAADDAHRGRDDIAGGWIMVRAKELSIHAILEALRTGAFYSTQGPLIESVEYERTNGHVDVEVRCSGAASVRFKGRTFTGAVVQAEPGRSIGRAVYQVRGNEKYVRIEVTDTAGRKAWTNPVFLEALPS